MANWKYDSGYSQLQKKRRIDALVESQRGALDKFVTTQKEKSKNISEYTSNDKNNTNKVDDNECLAEELLNNQENHGDPKSHIEDEQIDELSNLTPKNIFDLNQWTNINNNMREFLVQNGPIKIYDMDFLKDEFSRHFSSPFYIQNLANGEKYERRWLVYST